MEFRHTHWFATHATPSRTRGPRHTRLPTTHARPSRTRGPRHTRARPSRTRGPRHACASPGHPGGRFRAPPKARQLGAALLAGVVAAVAMVAVGVGRLEVASAVSAPLADVPAPVPRFSWPLGPPHPVLRPFAAPATPYGPGHRGVDLGGTPGEPVFAAADGVVVFAGDVASRGVLSIDHAGGLRTTYEPVAAAVVAGERVVAGAIIGHLQPGHPDCPVAACLHWGVRRGGEYLDPLALVLKVRVRLLPWEPDG